MKGTIQEWKKNHSPVQEYSVKENHAANEAVRVVFQPIELVMAMSP